MVSIRKPYDIPVRCSVSFDDPVVTEQNHKDSCDINLLIKKYERGSLPLPDMGVPQFCDVSEVLDLKDAMNAVNDANERFFELPSDIRKRFDNSPVKLLRAIDDPSMRSELISLGVLNAPPTPDPSPVVNPPPEGSPE